MTSSHPMPMHAIVVRTPGEVSADVDGEVVILSIDSGKYYNLDAVGSRIWALVEAPLSIAALHELLVGEFDVDRETCREDLLSFLRELHACGLLQISDA